MLKMLRLSTDIAVYAGDIVSVPVTVSDLERWDARSQLSGGSPLV